MRPEVVLQHKARSTAQGPRRPRGRLAVLSPEQRAWLRDGVRRVYGADHPWLVDLG